GLKRNLWWHPYDAKLYAGMRGLLDFMHGRGLGARLSALRKVIAILPRYWGKD
ncbi:MAG: hypothetical protein JNG89_00890, partial [Planctomycetaceae bacterium]|nr:hypothetical protein [Planctomycetaceae bacterium]